MSCWVISLGSLSEPMQKTGFLMTGLIYLMLISGSVIKEDIFVNLVIIFKDSKDDDIFYRNCYNVVFLPLDCFQGFQIQCIIFTGTM